MQMFSIQKINYIAFCLLFRLLFWVMENRPLKPNTHRRRRRDETVLFCRVGVGGVYMNSQL